MRGLGIPHEALDGLLVPHVQPRGARAGADRGGGLRSVVSVEIRADHGSRARRSDGDGERSTDAGARAGDDGYLVVEIHGYAPS